MGTRQTPFLQDWPTTVHRNVDSPVFSRRAGLFGAGRAALPRRVWLSGCASVSRTMRAKPVFAVACSSSLCLSNR
jgi:hypothetical protein